MAPGGLFVHDLLYPSNPIQRSFSHIHFSHLSGTVLSSLGFDIQTSIPSCASARPVLRKSLFRQNRRRYIAKFQSHTSIRSFTSITMKYQILASIGAAIFGMAATVSAIPLAPHEEEGFCPKGYKMVVWYETVWPTPSAASTLAISSSPSASSTLETSVQSQSPLEVESSTPIGDVAVSTSSTPAPAPVPTTSSTSSSVPTSEAPVPETTQAVVFATSTESSAAQIVAPTTHAAAQVITFSETTSSTTSSISTATSTVQAASTSSSSSSSPSSSSSSGTSGEATFYGGNVAGGTCSFSDYTLPSSLFGTALSVDQWSDASKCGACVAVTGPSGKTIKAMVVIPTFPLTVEISANQGNRSSTNAPPAQVTTSTSSKMPSANSPIPPPASSTSPGPTPPATSTAP